MALPPSGYGISEIVWLHGTVEVRKLVSVTFTTKHLPHPQTSHLVHHESSDLSCCELSGELSNGRSHAIANPIPYRSYQLLLWRNHVQTRQNCSLICSFLHSGYVVVMGWALTGIMTIFVPIWHTRFFFLASPLSLRRSTRFFTGFALLCLPTGFSKFLLLVCSIYLCLHHSYLVSPCRIVAYQLKCWLHPKQKNHQSVHAGLVPPCFHHIQKNYCH